MSVDFFWDGPSMIASCPCVFAFGVGADVVGLAVWWVLYRCLIISPPFVFTEEEQNKCPLFALHDSCGEGKELRTSDGMLDQSYLRAQGMRTKMGIDTILLIWLLTGNQCATFFLSAARVRLWFLPLVFLFLFASNPFLPPLLIS